MRTNSGFWSLILIAVAAVSALVVILLLEDDSGPPAEHRVADEMSGVEFAERPGGSGEPALETSQRDAEATAEPEIADQSSELEESAPEETSDTEPPPERIRSLPGGGLPRDAAERRRRNRERNLREGIERNRAESDALRQLELEMGSDEYDQMLYDSGEPNRVSMKWMTPNSAGTAAGIRPGDLLLTYDGIPIYNEDGVRWRNNLAEPGQSIRVEFIRNGEIYAAEIVRDAQPASMGGSVNGIRFKKEYVEPHLGQ